MTYASLDELFLAICDAIRSKEGSGGLISHQDIPDRIDGLSGLEAAELSGIYLWKKYTGTEEYEVTETEQTNVNLSYFNPANADSWDVVKYSDEIKVVNGEITLVEPISITLNSTSDNSVLLGKYVYSGNTKLYYRIPEDTSVAYYKPTYGTTEYVRAYVAMELAVTTTAVDGGELIGYTVSTDKTRYPEDGNVEGYKYVYIGTAEDGTCEEIPEVEQATPSITVSTSGLITASATQEAGQVAAGTKSATKQLTTQDAKTYTPGTSDQTIASGMYLSGVQTIEGDSDLVASNIKSGVSIFGVAGSYEGENTNGSSGGLAVRSGEVIDSTVIETGLSSVSYFMLYKTSFAETGLIQAAYGNEDATALAIACVSYSDYVKSCGIAKPNPIIEGGKITWPHESTSTSGMSSGKTYKWVAFGEE